MWALRDFFVFGAYFVVIYYVIFVFKYWSVLKFMSSEHGFYRVPFIPLLGSTYMALIIGTGTNILAGFNWANRYVGSPFVAWLGFRGHYITSTPSEIEIILNHPECFEKAEVYEKFKLLFKHSLLLLPYEEWSQRRRYYQKSFTPNILKQFFPFFYEQSSELVQELKDSENNDIIEVCNKYGFEIFARTSAGLENKDIFGRIARFGQIINSIQEQLSTLIIDPITPPNIWYNYYPAGRTVKKLNKEAEDIIRELINAKRKQLSEAEGDNNKNREFYPLLDLMVDMTDEECIEELMLFATAASDASGLSIAYTFTLLGMNPDVQDHLYKEIITLVGQKEICYDDLSNAVYLKAVISESLRLLPPIPHIARKVSGDVNLGTKVLPKNIDCVVDIFNLHRNPSYWPNPLKFDPTRFLGEKETKIQRYTYLPFSGGRRDCIGKRQIMLVLMVTVANVVRKFEIYSKYKSIEELELTSCPTMQPTHHLDCHFKPR